jgi:hypothetical protein
MVHGSIPYYHVFYYRQPNNCMFLPTRQGQNLQTAIERGGSAALPWRASENPNKIPGSINSYPG